MSISPTCTAPLTPTEREPLASEWPMRGIGETVPIRERIDVNVAAHTDQTQRRAPLLRGAEHHKSSTTVEDLHRWRCRLGSLHLSLVIVPADIGKSLSCIGGDIPC